eukprot:12113617-Alexandrium_andersonii.AAC.1
MSASLVGSEMCIRDRSWRGGRPAGSGCAAPSRRARPRAWSTARTGGHGAPQALRAVAGPGARSTR